MHFPKLKNPSLCRVLSYVVVLSCAAVPIVAVLSLPFPGFIQLIVTIGSLIGLLFYLVRNFIILMTMDMVLGTLSCHKTARKQYTLPARRTANKIRRSILSYGMDCTPVPLEPQPSALRYRFSNPVTIYSRGIERVIAAYEVDLLDPEKYKGILSSAKANSKALIGRKKALFLDAQQKQASLHRVTVVLILAHKLDPQMVPGLYELVCRQCGDENENCLIPCVVDLERNTCVFNCLRVPYIGFSYAVKNRGIRMIKRLVFSGNWNLRGNTQYLPSVRDTDPEDSLWKFWKTLHHQFIGAERAVKKQFESMQPQQICMVKDVLYLKWDHRGICQEAVLDPARKTVKVEDVTEWYYPKMQPIGNKTITKIKEQITAYYEKQGYTVEFVDEEATVGLS